MPVKWKMGQQTINDAKVIVPRRLRAFKTDLAIEVFKEMVSGTPRLTGRAQYSWRVAVGAPDPWFAPRAPGDKKDFYPKPSSDAWSSWLEGNYRDGESIFVSLNVPYAQRLNSGKHSSQATRPWVGPGVRNAVSRTHRMALEARRAHIK